MKKFSELKGDFSTFKPRRVPVYFDEEALIWNSIHRSNNYASKKRNEREVLYAAERCQIVPWLVHTCPLFLELPMPRKVVPNITATIAVKYKLINELKKQLL